MSDRPSRPAHSAAASASRVSSAVRYGRSSPTTTACEMSGSWRERGLDLRGGDVLAVGGDDEVLLATRDAQVAVRVERARGRRCAATRRRRSALPSPSGCPSSPTQTLGARTRISPSSAMRTSTPGMGRPTVPIADVVHGVERRAQRHLGLPVALGDRQSDAVEPAQQVGVHRGGARRQDAGLVEAELAGAARRRGCGRGPRRRRGRRSSPHRPLPSPRRAASSR